MPVRSSRTIGAVPPIMLVHPKTKGLFEALTDDQAEALALTGWERVADSRAISVKDLQDRAAEAHIVLDPKASKDELAKAVVHATFEPAPEPPTQEG